MMEAVRNAEISIYSNENTWLYILEDSKLKTYTNYYKSRSLVMPKLNTKHCRKDNSSVLYVRDAAWRVSSQAAF